MRAVVRSAWSRCVCNLHWLMQAAAIQGAVLQRLTVVSLRANRYLTLERKDLLGFLGYRHPKTFTAPEIWALPERGYQQPPPPVAPCLTTRLPIPALLEAYIEIGIPIKTKNQ